VKGKTMAQGATLQFYDGDIYSSYEEATKENAVTGVFLDYANDDTMDQTAVWDAMDIIHAALKAVGKENANLYYVLTRGGKVLDADHRDLTE